MSINRDLPHVVVLPEDDANRQIANGFALECSSRQLKVESEIGGWMRVVEDFLNFHVTSMRAFPERIVVLVIDFDDHPERLVEIREKIPKDLVDRAFVLGCLKEPEDLKRSGLGTFEEIGRSLAKACVDVEVDSWNHPLMRHNATELSQLREIAAKILWQ